MRHGFVMVTDEPAGAAGETPSSPRVRCPTCGARTSWRDNPQRPFCSLTCRLIDLGGWLDERHRIPARENDEEDAGPNVP